jgi:DNA polymerase-3 subunit delta'
MPWLRGQWANLAQRLLHQRLPQALLLSGVSGIGKSAFAQFVARAFLCDTPTADGHCGQCDACRLFAAGTHPDFLAISPEEGKAQISIDQIRRLIEEMGLTPQCSRYKVAVLDPAEAMNANAANALLKTLEEPASTHVLMLVSTTPGFLPATIRSRCQAMRLHVENAELAQQWLQQQGLDNAAELLAREPNAPLRAMMLADGEEMAFRQGLLDVVLAVAAGRMPAGQAAAQYAKADTRRVLALLLRWFAQSAELKLAGCLRQPPDAQLYSGVKALSDAFDHSKIFNIYSQLLRLHGMAGSSFKTQTVLEGIFADMRLNQLN